MPDSRLAFRACVPASGFRWIRRDDEGRWQLAQPPADWTARDYEAADYDLERPPIEYERAEQFYLAASEAECPYPDDVLAGLRKTIVAPDLYLRFASERGAPFRIMELANRYGFMDDTVEGVEILDIDGESAAGLISAFGKVATARAEPVTSWLAEFGRTKWILRTWSRLKEERDPGKIRDFIENWYAAPIGGSLYFHLDADDESIRGEMVAASLSDYIRIQLGLSLATILHRQCPQCDTWFQVDARSGRPEKVFCSNACRMRAYRARKGRAVR